MSHHRTSQPTLATSFAQMGPWWRPHLIGCSPEETSEGDWPLVSPPLSPRPSGVWKKKSNELLDKCKVSWIIREETRVLGHSFVRLLVCSHRSLIRLLRTAHFARALRCAHSFAHLLTSLVPSLVGQWMLGWLFILCSFLYSGPQCALACAKSAWKSATSTTKRPCSRVATPSLLPFWKRTIWRNPFT